MCFACVAGVHAGHLLPLFCNLPTLDSCRNVMGIQVLVLNTGKKYHGFDLEQALMGTCVSAKKQLIFDSVWPCLTHACTQPKNAALSTPCRLTSIYRHALETALKGDNFVYYWLAHTRGGVRGEETRQRVRACRLSHTQR